MRHQWSSAAGGAPIRCRVVDTTLCAASTTVAGASRLEPTGTLSCSLSFKTSSEFVPAITSSLTLTPSADNGDVLLDGSGVSIPGSVYMTSINDQDTGADSNPDQFPPAPRPGDWGGIDFRNDIDSDRNAPVLFSDEGAGTMTTRTPTQTCQ